MIRLYLFRTNHFKKVIIATENSYKGLRIEAHLVKAHKRQNRVGKE